MFVSRRAAFGCALAASIAAGCSSAPHGSPLPAVPDAPSSRAVHRHARVTLRVTIPKRLRLHRERFVSPSTQSMSVSENGVALGSFDTTPGSSGCQSANGGAACEFTIGAIAGANQSFTISAFDARGGKGTMLSSGTVTQNIDAGISNTLLVTLSGVVASVTIALPNPNPPAGSPTTFAVTVMAKDADGNVIIGPGKYGTAITLTDSDSSGIVNLSATKIAGPGTNVTLTYNGKPITSATIGATVTGLPASKITKAVFAPTPTIVTDFALPLAAGSTPIDPTAITTGPDGNIWIAYHSHNTTTSGFIKLPPAGPMPATPSYVEGTSPSTNLPLEVIDGLAAGPDGNVWYAGQSGDIGFITPSGNVTNYPLSGAPGICASPSAWRLVGSADGGFWVTIGCSGGGTQIAHVTTSGTIAPYTIAGFDYVNGLIVGKDGNVYAAGEMHSNGHAAIAQAIVSGATIVSSNLLDVAASGTNTNLNGIFQTPDGDLWVTNNSCTPSVVTRIHPAATFASSTASAYPSLAGCAYLAYGTVLADGTLWLADGNYPILTRVTPGAYPAAPALWDLAAPSTVQGYEWDVTLGPDGDLYVADYDLDTSSGTSGDVLKVAY